MAPPGRRKGLPSIIFYLLAFLCACSTASAASAVLGIDLGTAYIKAGIAKPGSPIDVVLTKDTKRKEAATLAFKPSRLQSSDADAFPERLYGGDAQALAARYPSDVFPNLKPLLGLSIDHDDVATYTSRFPGIELDDILRGEDGNKATVGIRSKHVPKEMAPFMVEELLAMELKNIKVNAEAAVAKGVSVDSVVLTYPSSYTSQEKRALELAADLAGFRVLSLISDGTAVGVNYATIRTFESVTNGAKPEYNVVYDMGAGSTTATVLKFQGRTIRGPGKRNQTIQEVIALGTAYDKTLGGDSFNDVIVEDMLQEFVQHKKSKSLDVQLTGVRTHGKTMARIWKEAERMRQVLSANSAAYASLEGLYHEDINFKYSLTRDRFEELTLGYAARVKAPLVAALEAAGIKLSELDSIILHGGTVRTPFVQKQLELAAGDAKKIKTNVNADEAAVLGATFQAATVSPSFRVKDIRAHDISGSAVTLKWTADGKERQQKLFTPLSQIGLEKQVPLKIFEDVKFEFVEERDNEMVVAEVEATNLTKSVSQLKDKHGCVPANISTVFHIRLSPFDGLPEIVSGSVSCKTDGSKDGSVLDNVKGLFGFGGKKDQVPLDGAADEADDPASMTPEPIDDPTSSGSTMSAASPSESGSAAVEDTAATTVTTATAMPTPSEAVVFLSLKSSARGLNVPPEKSLPRMRQRITDFDASDRNTVLRSEALNTLEAFTYRARDYLEDAPFIAVSSDKVRKQLTDQLSVVSEWIYGDGVDAKLQDFKDRLKQLRALVDPVLKRKEENAKRGAAVEALKTGLDSMKGTIEMVESSIKRAVADAASKASSASAAATESLSTSSVKETDDLDDDPYSSTTSAAEPEETEELFKPYEYSQDDLTSLTKVRETVQTWLDKKLAAQDKLGPYDDPAVLVSELEAKSKEVQSEVTSILMKTIKMQGLPKKPKPSKKPKSTKSKSTKSKKSGKATKPASTSTSEASSTTKDIHNEL